jgi:hypothetical protein
MPEKDNEMEEDKAEAQINNLNDEIVKFNIKRVKKNINDYILQNYD